LTDLTSTVQTFEIELVAKQFEDEETVRDEKIQEIEEEREVLIRDGDWNKEDEKEFRTELNELKAEEQVAETQLEHFEEKYGEKLEEIKAENEELIEGGCNFLKA